MAAGETEGLNAMNEKYENLHTHSRRAPLSFANKSIVPKIVDARPSHPGPFWSDQRC